MKLISFLTIHTLDDLLFIHFYFGKTLFPLVFRNILFYSCSIVTHIFSFYFVCMRVKGGGRDDILIAKKEGGKLIFYFYKLTRIQLCSLFHSTHSSKVTPFPPKISKALYYLEINQFLFFFSLIKKVCLNYLPNVKSTLPLERVSTSFKSSIAT